MVTYLTDERRGSTDPTELALTGYIGAEIMQVPSVER